MYEIIKKNWDKSKYLLLSLSVITALLLVSVVYKNDQKIDKNSELAKSSVGSSDLKTFKEFLLNRIKSPFINLDYEIQKGDSIQKILKKYRVKDNHIQTVISQYKKYGNPSQLLVGNKIDIIIEESLSSNNNSIIKFSVPVTKSTTISITKDEDGEILAKKIITKLYKRKTLAEEG